MEHELNEILEAAAGTWGVVIKPLGRWAVFERNADTVFSAASIGKVPIALYLLHLVDSGATRLDQTFVVSKEYLLPGSGVLQYLTPGISFTLKDLMALMLIVSDNTAAKLLARAFGPEKVNDHLASLGLKKTRLGLHDDGTFDFGVTTAHEMTSMLEGIYDARFVSKTSSELLIETMKKCENDKAIRRYLPHDGSNGRKLEVANKGGALDSSRHDIGIVFTSQPYIIVALSKDLPDAAYKPDNVGLLTIAQLSAAAYRQMA